MHVACRIILDLKGAHYLRLPMFANIQGKALNVT